MHGCHLLRTHPDPHTDTEPQHAPLKRKRTLQPSETSRTASPPLPHKAHQTQKQAPTATERAAQAQVQELKAELAKARANTAAAVALAAERESPGLGGTVDRLFSSRTCVFASPPPPLNPSRAGIWLAHELTWLGIPFPGSATPAVQRRPGASLANPNKAARRVTAVEFASDGEDA